VIVLWTLLGVAVKLLAVTVVAVKLLAVTVKLRDSPLLADRLLTSLATAPAAHGHEARRVEGR